MIVKYEVDVVCIHTKYGYVEQSYAVSLQLQLLMLSKQYWCNIYDINIGKDTFKYEMFQKLQLLTFTKRYQFNIIDIETYVRQHCCK